MHQPTPSFIYVRTAPHPSIAHRLPACCLNSFALIGCASGHLLMWPTAAILDHLIAMVIYIYACVTSGVVTQLVVPVYLLKTAHTETQQFISAK
jgi:hypothetical protein